MANIYKEFLWGLTMYSKKEKKEMFVDLNRLLNTKQNKINKNKMAQIEINNCNLIQDIQNHDFESLISVIKSMLRLRVL